MKKSVINFIIFALLIITSQSYAQDALWLNAIGKTQESKEVKLIYQKFGKPDIPENNTENILHQMSGAINPWYKKGLLLKFASDEYDMLRAITFHNIDPKYSKYTQTLPLGMSFTDTPTALKNKFNSVEKSKDYKNAYNVKFNEKDYPNYYLFYKYKQGKIAYIQLIREDYKSFSPFEIDENGTDCEMIATIFKDIKYNFTHLRANKNSEDTFSSQWSSKLNPSFSKKTIIESDLISFELYKGSDLEFAAETISNVERDFRDCVLKNGYKINMQPRESEASIIFISEDEDFEINATIAIDTETINGKETDIYTCTITLTNYKEFDGCELIEYFYENAITDFRYLKKELLETGIIDIWDTNITTFSRSNIKIRNKSIQMMLYDGTSLKAANSELATIYNTWDNCKEDSSQGFIFLEDKNTLDETLGTRKITYASYDDIYITFKIFSNFNTDENKPNDKYSYKATVTLYHKE